ncbi:MAG: hypothetical protein AB1756_07540 [Acidobacteriota bacterium]
MRCSVVNRLIFESLCGTIKTEDEKALDEHLSICRRCALEKEKMGQLLDRISRQEEVDPGEAYWGSFNERVFSKIDKRSRERRLIMPISPWRWIAAAGAVAIFLITILFSYRYSIQKQPQIARYEMRVQEAIQEVGAEEIDDLLERVIPFYQQDSLYFRSLDVLFINGKTAPVSINAFNGDDFIPYFRLEEMSDSEKEKLIEQMESEMI